uniref:PawS-like protein 1a n=1 Tax=Streptoglossa macrocephala TaxID=1954296 RepID=A0A1V0JB53_9ASTR|nr:PawS-like protein 1a [Streptoglossa macrocephala]
MVKLVIVALALAAIFAFAEVSAYRTTITTTVVDNGGHIYFSLPKSVEENGGHIYESLPDSVEENGGHIPKSAEENGGHIYESLPTNTRGSQGQCRRQIQGQQLNHCQMHVTQGIIRMTVENRSQQHLDQCCNQLQRMQEQCQCEAIQQVVDQVLRQQQQGGRPQQYGGQQQQQGGQQQQILRKAQMLPNQCNLRVQQCPIRIPRGV